MPALDLFQTLTQLGAIPGEDFSIDAENGVCRLNERSYELLKQHRPDVDWERVTEVVEVDHDEAIAALENQLGTPFVDRILEALTLRLQELPAAQAAWYLQQVLGGVEQRTSVPLYVLLAERSPLTRMAYVESLLRMEPEPCYEWMPDLIIAAGGIAEDCQVDGEDVLLSEQGILLLATVWMGEYDLYEAIADNATDQSLD